MLKITQVLGILGLAVFISFSIFCVMTFVVLPKDTLHKSTYHVQSQAVSLQRSRISQDFQNKTNSRMISRGRSPTLLTSINNTNHFPIQPLPDVRRNKNRVNVSPRRRQKMVESHQQNKVSSVQSKGAERKVNIALLAGTLRNHGMHPEQARALISRIFSKDDETNRPIHQTSKPRSQVVPKKPNKSLPNASKTSSPNPKAPKMKSKMLPILTPQKMIKKTQH